MFGMFVLIVDVVRQREVRFGAAVWTTRELERGETGIKSVDPRACHRKAEPRASIETPAVGEADAIIGDAEMQLLALAAGRDHHRAAQST
jgi:hypothetical protein